MQYLQKRTHECTFTCTSTRNDEKLDLAKLPIIRTKVIYATGFSVFNALYALFIVSFKRGRGGRTHKLAITAPHTSRRVKVLFLSCFTLLQYILFICAVRVSPPTRHELYCYTGVPFMSAAKKKRKLFLCVRRIISRTITTIPTPSAVSNQRACGSAILLPS